MRLLSWTRWIDLARRWRTFGATVAPFRLLGTSFVLGHTTRSRHTRSTPVNPTHIHRTALKEQAPSWQTSKEQAREVPFVEQQRKSAFRSYLYHLNSSYTGESSDAGSPTLTPGDGDNKGFVVFNKTTAKEPYSHSKKPPHHRLSGEPRGSAKGSTNPSPHEVPERQDDGRVFKNTATDASPSEDASLGSGPHLLLRVGDTDLSSFREERRLTQALRNQVVHHMQQEQHSHFFAAFVSAHKELEDIERGLRQVGGYRAINQHNDRKVTTPRHAEGVADSFDYSAEARVLQLVRRMQRTLKGLTTAHYTAAATPPLSYGFSSSIAAEKNNIRRPPTAQEAVFATHKEQIKRACLLQSFLKTTSNILRHLRGLPSRTNHFISVAQAEIYFRTSGACNASCEAIRTLIEADHTLAEREHALWGVFRAALLLPVADSPTFAIKQSSSDENDGADAFLPSHMRAEEWCVWALLQRACQPHRRAPFYSEANVEKGKRESNPKGTRRGKHAECLSPAQRIAVVRQCMTAAAEQSPGAMRSAVVLSGIGTDRSALRVPYGLGKAYTRQLIRDLLGEENDPAEELSKQPHPSGDDEAAEKESCNACKGAELKTPFSCPLPAQGMATLCAAIIFFEVHTREALKLLVHAAPVCVEQVELLSGHEISCLLLAYATLRYGGDTSGAVEATSDATGSESAPCNTDGKRKEAKNFYLVLGTRAGRLADSLSEADVARVLRALELRGLPHEDLRASLESSLRMRSLQRKIRFNIG